jgi:hypothetical protein
MYWDKKLSLALLVLLGLVNLVKAQGNPGFVEGAHICANYPNTDCSSDPNPNPLSLNQAFINKQDTLNVTSVISPPYNAKCDGVTDDSSAFQAAINATSSGGLIVVPSGKTCSMSNHTLSINFSNITIDGGNVGTTLVFNNATANNINIGNMAGLPGPSNIRLRHLTIKDNTARTAGYGVNVLGASQPGLEDVIISVTGTHTALYVQQFNDMIVRDSRLNGAVVLFSPANSAQRSDQFTIDRSVIQPNSPTTCMQWDGMVQTVNSNRLVMLGCTIGLAISNNSHNSSFYPAFGTFTNLQIDGASQQALWIQAGYNMQFIASDLNSSGTTADIPIVQIDPDAGASGSITRQVKLIGGGVHDTYGRCIVSNSIDFSIIGTDVYDCGKNTLNTYSAIEITQAGGTSNALIANSKIGFALNQIGYARYGVSIDSSVTGVVALAGNNFANPMGTAAVNDNAGMVRFLGNNIDINGTSVIP